MAILRRCGATRVVLFGSALGDPEGADDLDLACRGLTGLRFLDAVGDLMDEVPVPVDLVDLSAETPVTRPIEERGRVVYER